QGKVAELFSKNSITLEPALARRLGSVLEMALLLHRQPCGSLARRYYAAEPDPLNREERPVQATKMDFLFDLSRRSRDLLGIGAGLRRQHGTEVSLRGSDR